MNIKSSVAVACSLPSRAKDLSAPRYMQGAHKIQVPNAQHVRSVYNFKDINVLCLISCMDNWLNRSKETSSRHTSAHGYVSVCPSKEKLKYLFRKYSMLKLLHIGSIKMKFQEILLVLLRNTSAGLNTAVAVCLLHRNTRRLETKPARNI
jgi:hypothetical protein